METSEVRPNHRFDIKCLHKYLLENINEHQNTKLEKSKIKISQYVNGESNPTFYVKLDEKEYVMRKQPNGELLKGAH